MDINHRLVMKKKNLIALVFLLAPLFHFANNLPIDNAVLNYTQVMFEFDEKPGADTYILTILPAKAGMMRKTRYVNTSLACLVTEDLEFDKKYRWYYEAFKKGKPYFRSDIFHFSIAKNILVNNNNYRYHIIKKEAGHFQNNLVFIENLGVAVNRSGQPMWYLPIDTGAAYKAPQYRNLAMTKEGKLTLLQGEQAIEKNLEGVLTWKAPDDGSVSGDAKEFYHHDFTRLDDGTYLACSYKWDTTFHYYHDTIISRVRYNTVIQYDPSGQVLWHWNEKDHVNKEEIFSMYRQPDKEVAGTHMNGMSYDKNTNSFLFSFRDNSSILRIDKQTGKVLYALKGTGKDPIVFHSQHSPVVLSDGSVLIYNNNASFGQGTGGKIIYPTILNVTIPVKNGVAKKIWEYECRMQDYPNGLVGKEGYASELPNHNLLVCVGGANKIFEVTRSKKIVWEMNFEEFITKENRWIPFNNYRAHFTSSLYPSYFTIQNVSGQTDYVPNTPLQIKINNDGTENDEYKIELFSSGILTDYSAVLKIAAGKSTSKKIVLAKNPSIIRNNDAQNYVVVKVTAASNPEVLKTITYNLK